MPEPEIPHAPYATLMRLALTPDDMLRRAVAHVFPDGHMLYLNRTTRRHEIMVESPSGIVGFRDATPSEIAATLRSHIPATDA